MTPEEKAKELFDKYFDLYPDQDAYFIAQLAAIIAIDECLNALRMIDDSCFEVQAYNFYENVKKEIEQL